MTVQISCSCSVCRSAILSVGVPLHLVWDSGGRCALRGWRLFVSVCCTSWPAFLGCSKFLLLKELSSYRFPCPPSLLPITLSSVRGVSGEAFQECSINVRAQEPRVGISLHQPVNYLLSVVKAVHGGSFDVPFDLLSSVIVYVDLEWGTHICMRGFQPKAGDVSFNMWTAFFSRVDTKCSMFKKKTNGCTRLTSLGDSALMNCS